MSVAVALVRSRTVRSGLAVNRSLAIGSRTIGVMMIRLLNNHRRCRRRSLLAAAEYKRGCGRK